MTIGWSRGLAVAAMVLAGEQAATAQVVITEIMYDPASGERTPVKTEWVEIFNASDEAVDVGGWWLEDEDGRTVPFPQRVPMAPGEAIVLVPGDVTIEAFRSAWGAGFQVIPLDRWAHRGGLHGLANTPTADNEMLTLRNTGGRVVDEVNFQGPRGDDGDTGWPAIGRGGASIYLLPTALDAAANDRGESWAASRSGVHGGREVVRNAIFNGRDVGSPGRVEVPASSKTTDAGAAP